MIDARDYDSTEDLAEAMNNERNINLLKATRKRIAEVESFIGAATYALKTLKRDAEKLEFKIKAYEQKVAENGKDYKRWEYDESEFWYKNGLKAEK